MPALEAYKIVFIVRQSPCARFILAFSISRELLDSRLTKEGLVSILFRCYAVFMGSTRPCTPHEHNAPSVVPPRLIPREQQSLPFVTKELARLLGITT